MAKIKVDANLMARIQKVAESEGYSSAQEFVVHIVEKELAQRETDEAAQDKAHKRLKGLGYVE